MCTAPPSPPPLPNPPISNESSQNKIQIQNGNIEHNHKPNTNYPDVCKWTSQPALQEACSKNNICTNKPPYKYYYRHFDSIIQVGPTCGLVALSMLVKGEVTASEMLSIAKAEGYSNNGEMFSCQYMLELTRRVFSLSEVENVNYDLRKGGLFSNEIIEKLLNGGMLLVPYDADFNHMPCLKQGHTAHWALVCGIIVIDNPGDSYTSDPSNVYVLCRHGKSRYLAAWKLADLDKSNANLWEFSPKRGGESWVYILPDGGVGGDNGLKDQFLIFENLPE